MVQTIAASPSSAWALSVLTSTSWLGAAVAVVGILAAAVQTILLVRILGSQRTSTPNGPDGDVSRRTEHTRRRLRLALIWAAAGAIWAVVMTVLSRPELIPYAVASVGAAASVIAIVAGTSRARGTRSFNGMKLRTVIVTAAITAVVAIGLLFLVPQANSWFGGVTDPQPASCDNATACPPPA
ncbi:hypothetical protein [Leifsonia sp. TF02-11]|uniref:hypothetical protein n=1 Tax=Leifsonia sp. TF02-11 TaxID=2815212 RepID=UPI001AA1AA4A|nr:hypothetical protein [Leifsonia sp. TF02-11]MBO1741024.1 hypothetical protein [Leifsonia sp. TF02-11]